MRRRVLRGGPAPEGRAAVPDPFTATSEATAELWQRLARPYDPVVTVEALLGLSRRVVEQLVGVVVATCDEAEALLDSLPTTLRRLRTAIGTDHVRCWGELRGPVQWSETVAAQASSFGNTDVYVCAEPHRAYDIDENRVLVAALRAVADAGRLVESMSGDTYDDEGLRRARLNARRARRYLDHRTLSQIDDDQRPSRRAITRTRAGKANQVYRPALALLDRATEPLGMDELAAWCDRRTRVQHGLLVAVIRELERRGLRIPALRAENGSLFAGPVEYVHPRRRGERDRLSGILLGEVLIDVPESLRETDRELAAHQLAARAGGRPSRVIMRAADVPAAVDHAIVAARGDTTGPRVSARDR